MPIPGALAYDGFPQYENGIGMVRTMLDDWSKTKRRLKASGVPVELRGKWVVVGTAALIAPVLSGVAAEFNELTGANVCVKGVTNTVFGERVNVSGLVCGKDYVDQIRTDGTELYLLPRPSLDYFGEKFLDSMTVEEAEVGLGAPLGFASVWSDVVEVLANGPVRPARNEASNGAFWAEER
jgi:NifB/MoaA-like Fe-S oxidoreductase